MSGVPARNRQGGPTAFTWANRPDATAVPPRTRIWVSDFGVGGGSEWYSDGTHWRPVNNHLILPGTITPVTFTAQSPSLKINVHHSFAIPAGMIIPGCRIETLAKWDTAANTDNKYFRTYLNAASAGPYLSNYNVTTGTAITVSTMASIDFVTASSQLGLASAMSTVAVAAVAMLTGSVNTNNAFTVDICSLITSTSDSVTMKSAHGVLTFR